MIRDNRGKAGCMHVRVMWPREKLLLTDRRFQNVSYFLDYYLLPSP